MEFGGRRVGVEGTKCVDAVFVRARPAIVSPRAFGERPAVTRLARLNTA